MKYDGYIYLVYTNSFCMPAGSCTEFLLIITDLIKLLYNLFLVNAIKTKNFVFREQLKL